mgnify:FL=1
MLTACTRGRRLGSPALAIRSHTYGSAVPSNLAELGSCFQHEKLSQQKLGSKPTTKNMTKHLQSYKNHMAHAPVHSLYRTEKSNGNLFHMSQRLFPLVYMGEKKL